MFVLKKTIGIMLALCVALIPVCVFADENVSVGEVESRDIQINELLDQRIKLIHGGVNDIRRLNEIDLELDNLGVEFLSFNQVCERFGNIGLELSDNNRGGVEHPESDVNYWYTYTNVGYIYNNQYFDVIRLVAQPMTEESAIWIESQHSVSFNYNWTAGVTNLVTSLANSLAGALAPYSITVYNALQAGWSSLRTNSILDVSDVVYWQETSVSLSFAYVKRYVEDDDAYQLAYISSKAQTALGYIVDVDSWSETGNGVMLPVPNVKTGTSSISSIPTDYNSISKACYAYINTLSLPLNECLTSINITAPENKTAFSITTPSPAFPAQIEY